MRKPHSLLLTLCAVALSVFSCQSSGYNNVIELSDYGIKPNSEQSVTSSFVEVIDAISKFKGDTVVLEFEKGVYNFYPSDSSVREYYISNHDQDNPKMVGMAFENIENLVIDGNGAELIFHGRMLPMSLINTKNVIVRNLSIDFDKPHIGQITIVENDTKNHTITYDIAPWMDFEFRGRDFINKGYECENHLISAIAFNPTTRHILYQTSDVHYGGGEPEFLSERRVKVRWNNPALVEGTVLAMRSWYRPTPGIFVADAQDTKFENVKVHYAEGMGLLVQMSENITLDGFSVCLRGDDDPRYFTTQADATHFSACKGVIISQNGLYEAMMDDAINVHGTYLKIEERVDDYTVKGRYMHPQAWGFRWGEVGDSVQFVTPQTMELVGSVNHVKSIKSADTETIKGAKVFLITFTEPLAQDVVEACGIENLSWTPEVIFSDNVIRNNRARGALFSTPRATLVERNLFDHTSGTAILLCGDCNGWFETGACREVVIRKNIFRNALASMFQFTNGVISIYPEIPDLSAQEKYFHGNGSEKSILIEDNDFEMFDKPILYAKSVDGISFVGNRVTRNNEFEPYHWIDVPFYFDRVKNWTIEGNDIEGGFDVQRDVALNY